MHSALRARPARRQLRTNILELLLQKCHTTEQLANSLCVPVCVARAELLVLRHLYIVERVAEFTNDRALEPPSDKYYWDYLWDLTTHGRSHTDTYELLHCRGCSLRRRSGYALRP